MTSDIKPPEPKWSNCHLWAWGRFVDQGGCLLVTYTEWSKLDRLANHPLWLPVRIIGIGLQWTGQILNFLGWLLRWGRWYHVQWTPDRQIWWEYVPRKDKRLRYVPPVIFRGMVRRL